MFSVYKPCTLFDKFLPGCYSLGLYSKLENLLLTVLDGSLHCMPFKLQNEK